MDIHTATERAYKNGYAAAKAEIVRCAECAHRGAQLSSGRYFCTQLRIPDCRESDYCSRGEREGE